MSNQMKVGLHTLQFMGLCSDNISYKNPSHIDKVFNLAK